MIRKLYKKSLVKIMIRCLIITFFIVVAVGELKSTAYAKENIMPIFRMTDNEVLDYLNIIKEKVESGEINLGVKAKGMWKLPDYKGKGYLYKIDLEDREKSTLLIHVKNNHVETVSLDSTQYDIGNAINWFATILYGGKITQEKYKYINKCIKEAVRDYSKVVIFEREGENEWDLMASFTEKKSIFTVVSESLSE